MSQNTVLWYVHGQTAHWAQSEFLNASASSISIGSLIALQVSSQQFVQLELRTQDAAEFETPQVLVPHMIGSKQLQSKIMSNLV